MLFFPLVSFHSENEDEITSHNNDEKLYISEQMQQRFI